jgi:SAM-dependent methyltransferase
MKFEEIDNPGTICFKSALFEIMGDVKCDSFLEVGCGSGGYSLEFLKRGCKGVGIDFSSNAIARASRRLAPFIEKGRYKLIEEDFSTIKPFDERFDVVIALNVMEHLEDDLTFLKKLKTYLKPGGHIIIAVPQHANKWSILDDAAGHFRRYSKKQLSDLLTNEGFINPKVWSTGFPLANILQFFFNLSLSYKKQDKAFSSKTDQTKTSGIMDLPFVTVFPPFFKIVLNRKMLWPFRFTQRFFYKGERGLSLLAMAECQK